MFFFFSRFCWIFVCRLFLRLLFILLERKVVCLLFFCWWLVLFVGVCEENMVLDWFLVVFSDDFDFCIVGFGEFIIRFFVLDIFVVCECGVVFVNFFVLVCGEVDVSGWVCFCGEFRLFFYIWLVGVDDWELVEYFCFVDVLLL